jgi:hypothetical protein
MESFYGEIIRQISMNGFNEDFRNTDIVILQCHTSSMFVVLADNASSVFQDLKSSEDEDLCGHTYM